MRRITTAVLAFALAAAVAPAEAQEWLVNRERFRYIGTRLTIHVSTEAAGRLQIIRGAPGTVRVAGRVPVGFAGSGLSGDGHLTLTAAGDGPVDFMVAVPHRVWIDIRLPDRSGGETVGAYVRTGSFEWSATPAPPVAAAGAVPLTADGALGNGLFTTYAADLAPTTISLPDLSAIRTVTVRTGGDRFRIGTSRPLRLRPGSARSLEIRPSGTPIDIVIEVPTGTADFGLDARGATALAIRDGVLTAACSPATRQWLSGSREWVTFSPVEGRLDCRVESARHKG